MDARELEKSLNWRYATKQFDQLKRISAVDWQALEQAFLLCPSSYGLQPWKFLVIVNPTLREKLKAASWNQSQVTDSSHYVVMLYKEKLDAEHIQAFVDRTAEVREVERGTLARFEQMMLKDLLNANRLATIDTWAKHQTYIAMGFVLQAAAVLNVDTCPMEGIDAEQYDQILGLAGTGYKTLVTIAFGYRARDDRYQDIKKVRFLKSDVIQDVN
jgi:nitroreductase